MTETRATCGPPRAADRSRRLASACLCGLFLLLVLITLRPFGPPDDLAGALSQGDPVNQYGFLFAGTLAVIGLASLTSGRVLLKLAGPLWIGLFAVLVLSVLVTPEPMDTARAVALTLIGMTIAASIVLLPQSEADFRSVVAACSLATLALAYASVVLVPQLAVHQPGELEAQHAGLWRGHYTHKNVAGPVMAVLAMAGLYVWRAGARLAGTAIFALALLFVVMTGSKTTLAFLPVSVCVVLLRPLFGSAGLVILAQWCVLLPAFLLTVGSVLFPPMADLVAGLPGDPSFTGRTTIWSFGLDAFLARPLTGYGFYDFWTGPFASAREVSIEAAWDVRGIGSGHSNFIDMPLFFGAIGGTLVLYAFLVAPAFDYWRSQRHPQNMVLADFFMTIVVFMSLTSLMESFLFNRVDSFWLLVAMAVFGLRLTARAPLKEQ